jgi:hypothetical protein
MLLGSTTSKTESTRRSSGRRRCNTTGMSIGLPEVKMPRV